MKNILFTLATIALFAGCDPIKPAVERGEEVCKRAVRVMEIELQSAYDLVYRAKSAYENDGAPMKYWEDALNLVSVATDISGRMRDNVIFFINYNVYPDKYKHYTVDIYENKISECIQIILEYE